MQINKVMLIVVALISFVLGVFAGYFFNLAIKNGGAHVDPALNVRADSVATKEVEPVEDAPEESPVPAEVALDPGFEVAVVAAQDPAFYSSYGQITIKAISDHVTIESLEINRGNCTVGGFGKRKLPANLKFGQSLRINSSAGCEVIEINVTADSGSWTYSFK